MEDLACPVLHQKAGEKSGLGLRTPGRRIALEIEEAIKYSNHT